MSAARPWCAWSGKPKRWVSILKISWLRAVPPVPIWLPWWRGLGGRLLAVAPPSPCGRRCWCLAFTTWHRDALGLVAESAGQVSPAMFPLAGFPPTVVVWGAVETREFKRQSRGFANLLTLAATPCDAFEIPARNHFDVILDLADPSTAMGARTLSLFAAK
jgi:hypothetical protein